MRLAMSGVSDEDLKLAVQVGATDVVGGGGLPTDKGYYTRTDLIHHRERIEEAGLRLSGCCPRS